MIDPEVKNTLLKELSKNGFVTPACAKVGIDRSTFYEWKNTDKDFAKKANKAIKIGRENNCDIAEYALMQNVKDKKMDAIKYVLGHQSKTYKPRDRRVFMVHSNKENSEKAVALKKKEHERVYYSGYSDAMKETIERLGKEDDKDGEYDDDIVSE